MEKATGIDNIPSEAIHAGGEVSVEALYKLLNNIWREDKITDEWKKVLLVKLPKKGDTTHYLNWRGVTLSVIPSKILSRFVLDRIRSTIDSLLRDEQAGFPRERSCTDQIVTPRIIIEQSLEWNNDSSWPSSILKRPLTRLTGRQCGKSYSITTAASSVR